MNIFKDLKIGSRLLVSLSFLIILLLGMAALSIWSIYSINQSMADAVTEFKKFQVAYDVNNQINGITIDVSDMIVAGDPAQVKIFQAEIDTHRAAYQKDMVYLKAAATTGTGKQLLASLEAAIAALRTENDHAIALVTASEKSQAATQFIGKVIPANQKENQAINDLLAYRQVRLDGTTQAADARVADTRNWLIAAAVFSLALAAVLGMIIIPSIISPLVEAVKFLDTVAKGDISKDPAAALLRRRDEMGALAQAMLKTAQYLRKNVKDISTGAESLSTSAEELSAVAFETSAGAKESAMKANSVAAAAEEMSANTVSVAAGMEQASTSLSSVATAVEEMTSTIGEIAKNSEKARSTTEQTARQINQYAGVMRGLGQSAREIGKFTETIASISAQTNLLALNATIEAARAGAAGKGFAVVANEIKELAQQTAAATGEIKNKISAIQVATAGAVEDVEKIVHIIQEVNDSVSSTAAAIQEQATVTQDIAMNIAQASHGIKDANHRVAQTATVSRAIARDIASVSETAGQITDASAITQTSAADLSRLAEQLNQLTLQFII